MRKQAWAGSLATGWSWVKAPARAMVHGSFRQGLHQYRETTAIAATALLLCMALFAGNAFAQQSIPQYDKYFKSAQTIGVLGKDLAGDSTNFYSGGTTFSSVDLSVPGNNSLPVAVGRRFNVEYEHGVSTVKATSSPYNPISSSRPFAFGDWDLDIPRITAITTQQFGWQIDSTSPLNRCSVIGQVKSDGSPTIGQPKQQSGPSRGDFWNGNTLHVAGEDQEMLLANAGGVAPTTGGPYHWTTNKNWSISCLPATANGVPGEAFLAISPDGTRYWFDWHSERNISPLVLWDDIGSNLIARYTYQKEVSLLPTRIQDRFGNEVNFSYSSHSFARLIQVTANDGRAIALTYGANGFVEAMSDGTRTVLYGYSGTRLTHVWLPDGSRWEYGFSELQEMYPTQIPAPLECGTVGWVSTHCFGLPSISAAAAAYVIHPSGTRVDFVFQTHFQWVGSDFSYPLGLSQKTISGPGVAPMKWQYAFAPTREQTQAMCVAGACPDRIWSDEISPEYRVTRRMFGLRKNEDEGLLLQELRGYLPTSTVTVQQPATNRIANTRRGIDMDIVDLETPVVTTGTTVTGPAQFFEETDYFYRAGAKVGTHPLDAHPIYANSQLFWAQRRTPISKRVTHLQDVATTYQVDSWDGLDRPLSTSRFSSLTPALVRNGTTEYFDDTTRWVLGQVSRTTLGGVETARTTFDADSLPWKTYGYGKLQQELGYTLTAGAQAGTLHTVKDGRGQVTTLSDWHRGIPRRIDYPDGTWQSATVNDAGWVTSVTDENSYVTGYGYDAVGRLASIAYPTGDSTAWATTTRTFQKVATAQLGLPANHWQQTVQTGNARQVTYYDALWRPVLAESYDNADKAATLSQAVTRYDSDNRAVFAGYPVRGLTDIANAVSGTRTAYDALGRAVRVEQDSELGVLATTTDYLSGLQTRTTNPRGAKTLTSYRVFDAPSLDEPMQIVHGEGTAEAAVTEIERDLSGKPTQLKRRNPGGTLQAVRSYGYDAYQQLCRTVEPETGATLMGYDAAGNLAWSASGLPAGTACDATGNTAAVLARKASRTYDARNRITALTFAGDGNGNQSWDYYLDGQVAQIHTWNVPAAGVAPKETRNVYVYNKRRLLTGETVTHPSLPSFYTFTTGYRYDANGSLAGQDLTSGMAVDYAPNALGQPTRVTGTIGGATTHYASNVTYHANGAIAGFTYGNGIVHAMTQNARQLPARSTDGNVLDLVTTFDGNGNTSRIQDLVRGTGYDRTMAYDALDRLLSAQSNAFGGAGAQASYSYDALDNLTAATAPGKDYAQYVYTGNRLTDIRNSAGNAVVGIGYDVQGNVENKNGQRYEFDLGNRLRRAYYGTGPDAQWEERYRYDGHGRRVLASKVLGTDSGVIFSQYASNGQLLYQENERASSGKATDYLYLAGSLIAQREVPLTGGTATVKYTHTDALGSPVAMTSATGAVLERIDYAPYGEQLTAGTKQDRPGYTGHVLDTTTGLNYAQQRYFDPVIGRFLSVDPVTANPNTGAMFNRYSYANNNPYAFVDPDGRQSRREAHEQRQRESFCNTGCDAGSFLGDSRNSTGLFGSLGSLLSKVSSGEHRYFNQTWACNDLIMVGCNEANLFDNGLLYHSAPSLDGEKRLAQNEIRLVLPLGYVRFTIDRQHWTVINHTTPNHALNEGFVVRQIVRRGHDLLIQTRGYGKGPIPAVNNYLNIPVWQTVDLNMLRSVRMSPGR